MWPTFSFKQPCNRRRPKAKSGCANSRRGIRVECLENRLCLSAVSWINPNGGNWDVGANWSTDIVPAAHDDVTINTAAAVTITIQSGDTESIHSLTTAANDTLSITGGSLAIGWNSTLRGPLAMTGGSLTASGVGVNVTVNGATTLNGTTSGGDVYAEGGATLALPKLTSYTAFASSGSPRTFQAEGNGSVLDVSALSTLAIRGDWSLNAINGGEVNLTGMTSLNGSSEGNINITDTGGSRIIDNNVTAIVGFRHVNGIDNGITLDGTDQHVADSWTKLTNSSWYVTGGSYALPKLTDIDDSSLSVFNGASLSLPGVTSYVANDTGFYANGEQGSYAPAPSALDLSGLTTVSMAAPAGVMFIDADHGGTLNLNGLTAIDGGSQLIFIRDETGGKLLDRSLSTLSKVNVTLDGTDPHVSDAWTKFVNGNLAISGGVYTLPNLTDVDGSTLDLSDGASLSLPSLTAFTAPGDGESISIFRADGAGSILDISTLAAVNVQNTPKVNQNPLQLSATNGGELKLNALTSLTTPRKDIGIDLEDRGGSAILDPSLKILSGVLAQIDGTDQHVADAWTQLTNGGLSITGGSYTLPQLSDATGSGLIVSGGGKLSLPSITTFTGTLAGDGAGSVLDLPAVTTNSGLLKIDATNGGQIKLGGLTKITTGPAATFVEMIDTGGSTIVDPNLTDLNGADATLDGTDPHVADSWLRFTNGLLTITGGSYALPKLTDADGSTLTLSNGATLATPGVTTFTGSLTINGGNLTMGALSDVAGLRLAVTGGGTIGLPALKNLKGNVFLSGPATLALAQPATLDNRRSPISIATGRRSFLEENFVGSSEAEARAGAVVK